MMLWTGAALGNSVPATPNLGETYHCPNGFAFTVVRMERDGSLVLGNPADRTVAAYTPEQAEKGTLYRERGFLSFFSFFVPADGTPIVFFTPDGPIQGCAVTP